MPSQEDKKRRRSIDSSTQGADPVRAIDLEKVDKDTYNSLPDNRKYDLIARLNIFIGDGGFPPLATQMDEEANEYLGQAQKDLVDNPGKEQALREKMKEEEVLREAEREVQYSISRTDVSQFQAYIDTTHHGSPAPPSSFGGDTPGQGSGLGQDSPLPQHQRKKARGE